MKKNQTSETVEEFLARAGTIQTIAPGESGIEYPVRRNRRAQINYLRRRDYLRKKKGATH